MLGGLRAVISNSIPVAVEYGINAGTPFPNIDAAVLCIISETVRTVALKLGVHLQVLVSLCKNKIKMMFPRLCPIFL